MTDTIALGRLIRESRLKKGLSLGQLAAAVGRSSSSVRRWERGEVAPAIAVIDDLADALDLEPDVLRAARPGPVSDSGVRPTTIEQPVVPEEPPALPEPQPEPQEPAASRGMFGDAVEAVRSAGASWSGWLRGALTAAFLLVMLIVLIWALGELFTALGDVWDSFDTGGSP
ncbi:MAG: helix-turn-helix domain-containing protein [Acidimicrobiia bacterium]